MPNWTLSTAASGAEERGQGQGQQCELITGASMTGLQLIAQSSPCCCRRVVVAAAAAGRGSRWPNPNQFRTPDEAS